MTSQCELLVIGGGQAGLATATAYRESGGEGTVRIVSADPQPPYHRPSLSKGFLTGAKEAGELPLQGEDFYAGHDLQLDLGRTVTSLDAGDRTATLDDGEQISYAVCVLATGSGSAVPPIDGAGHPDVRLLRSRDDAVALQEAAKEARSAVVIGSGFIGCEAAMSLASLGLDVTMMTTERLPQIDRLGLEVAGRIAGWLGEAGVTVIGGKPITAIDGGHAVVLDKRPFPADLVVLAAGAQPRGDLAVGAGVDTEDGRVLVDEHLASSVPGLYAAGDVARAENAAAGRALSVEHWHEAQSMGAVAGHNAAQGEGGEQRSWDSVPDFWTDLGERTLQYAGWGDGYDDVRLVDHGDEAFTAWYTRDVAGKPILVGVLTHDADDDLARGKQMIRDAEELPEGDVDSEPEDFSRR